MKGNPKKFGWVRDLGLFAVGATAGSVAALFYAPASGRVIRKRIALKFRSLERSTARGLNRTRKVLLRKVGDLREAAEEKLGHTREWLREHAVTNGRRPLHERRLAHHA